MKLDLNIHEYWILLDIIQSYITVKDLEQEETELIERIQRLERTIYV